MGYEMMKMVQRSGDGSLCFIHHTVSLDTQNNFINRSYDSSASVKQMPKHREVKKCIHGHMACTWLACDRNPGSVPEPSFLCVCGVEGNSQVYVSAHACMCAHVKVTSQTLDAVIQMTSFILRQVTSLAWCSLTRVSGYEDTCLCLLSIGITG